MTNEERKRIHEEDNLRSIQRKEAQLYYLFLSLDGKDKETSKKKFDEICIKLNLLEERKQYILDHNKSIKKSELLDKIYDEFDDFSGRYIDDNTGDNIYVKVKGKKGTPMLTEIVWNMMCMGYEGKKKEVVDHYIEVWGIKNDILKEMLDSYNTVEELVKQKEWMESITFKGKKKRMMEIDDDIKQIYVDVRLSIEEMCYNK